ncbi:MAG TPA: heme-binding protein, partial [Bryobacteraceae bacterium]|nr:heme-binding protein [Bryobacteraceae bacterium]
MANIETTTPAGGQLRSKGPAGNPNGTAAAPAPIRDITAYRVASTHENTGDRLGALRDLPGFWQGIGFSIIARPDFSAGNSNGFFLQLNVLQETIEFTPIGSPVINRGSLQSDIAIYGLTYLHRVTDAATGGALHIENGMWLNIPATTQPSSGTSIARLCTIPHGNAVCTVGFSEDVVFQGLPEIPPANTVPFRIGTEAPAAGTPNPYREYDLSQPSSFRSSNMPSEITQALINDPNQMLR